MDLNFLVRIAPNESSVTGAQLGKFAGRCSTFFSLLSSGMFIRILVNIV